MSATSISSTHRARPHGVDLLVMRASLAALMWARRRADRASMSREDHALRRSAVLDEQRRTHDNALRAARAR